jgi:histidine ammonia-lyase
VGAPPSRFCALYKVAGVVAVISALPGLMAVIVGFFALLASPDAPARAYVSLAFFAGLSIVLIGNGAKIFRGQVLAAAVTGAVYTYLTLHNLNDGRAIAAAFASLSAVLCLAVVIAAWRLRRADRTSDDGGAAA